MKILQWLFSSFFRTIGRTIAILVMGGMLYYILSINGIGISDLFLDNVKASGLVENVKYAGTNFFTLRTNEGYNTTESAYIIPVQPQSGVQRFEAHFNPILNTSNVDYVVFQVLVAQPQGQTYSYTDTMELENCQRWGKTTINNREVWECLLYSSNTNTLHDHTYVQPSIESYNFNMFVNWSNSQGQDVGWAMCSQSGNQFFCPTNHNFINFIGFFADYDGGGTNRPVNFMLFRGVNYYNYENTANAIINNQNQNTQSIIQQQQNATNQILDGNTTQADNTGKDFITNFSNNTHGLTGIITAPLNAIQSLSSATCTPLILPLPFTDNKTLTLPCMNTIYSQYFGAFYTMYQGIILGLISYWVCVRIFGLAKGFKDPEDDKIEVVDL